MAPPFRAIIAFTSVARTGSVTRAAEELGVTPSAVSQQVQLLEHHLGVVLTIKVGRNITLTEAGERYYQSIGREIEHIKDVTSHVRGMRTATALHVRASPSIATKWLLPQLQSFTDEHPDIELRFDGTNEPTDFSKDSVDIDIRHGDGNFPGLFVEPIGEERFAPLCSPALHAAHSLSPCDLPRQRLIHTVKSQMQWDFWFQTNATQAESRWRRILFDRSYMAIDAAIAGMGICLESILLAWHDIQDGRLVCPVADVPEVTMRTQWIICPTHHLRHRKTQAFLAWLRTQRDRWQAEQDAFSI